MEWVALGLWLFVVMLALPLGLGALYGRFSFALQALAAACGFGLVLLYIVLEGQSWLAWAAVGVGAVGSLVVLVAARNLISGGDAAVRMKASTEELVATLAGVELPLFVTAALLTVLVALGIGT